MASITTNFSESQRFNQPWLWVILIVIYISPLLANLPTVFTDGIGAAFSIGILNHVITLGVIILLIFILRLETTINSTGIQLRYFPFLRRAFTWEEIAEIEIINYSFRDVMGWGIRLGSRFGTVYNVRGYNGIRIVLKNGKKYLVGTQQPQQIKEIIARHKA